MDETTRQRIGTPDSAVVPVDGDEPGHPLRRAREAAMVEEARADIAAGRVVDEEVVLEWVASLDTDQEFSLPLHGR